MNRKEEMLIKFLWRNLLKRSNVERHDIRDGTIILEYVAPVEIAESGR
jgi:hypothetical protein